MPVQEINDRPEGIPLTYCLNPVPRLPDPVFPSGYGMRLMREDEVVAWQTLQKETEPFFKISDHLFMEEFGSNLDEAWKRCYFITAPDESVAGVISAWWKDDFRGGPWGKLHWLAVHPLHQGKGLARAATLVVLKRLGEEFGRVYLGTQSERLGAIALYESLGFRLQ